MSWVTVIWSMIASACLTLGAIYGLVWYRNRSAWAYLFFALTAASTAAFTFCELRTARGETPEELLSSMRWTHVALLCLLVSTTWFVTHYLNAGRRWLAWTVTGLRTFYLLIAFLVWGNVNYLEITSLRHEPFLGDSVTVFEGIQNPWMLFGYATMVVLLIFVADASVTAWRRGERRKALMVGGSVEFFLLLGTFQAALVHWAQLPIPVLIGPLYLGLVAVMGFEISHDVIRASQLATDLQATEAGLRESETRMSLAVEAVDFGIWIRDFARNEIWASERWRELFGFAPLEPLEFDAILNRLHPDDRENLQDAQTMAIAGAGGGKYQTEYRLMLPDGAIRWISSLGHVEWDATGQPVLIRGTARDVTARKRAEVDCPHAEWSPAVGAGRGAPPDCERTARQPEPAGRHPRHRDRATGDDVRAIQPRSWNPYDSSAHGPAEISKEIHSLSHRLHSTKLEALGLQAAVQGHCRELRAKGLQVQCRAENVPRVLPYEVALCLFRIVQEALNNVDKHSGAREAEVTLTGTSGALLVTIADSGRGFDEAACERSRRDWGSPACASACSSSAGN